MKWPCENESLYLIKFVLWYSEIKFKSILALSTTKMNYNIKYGYSESVHLKTSVLNFDFISVFGSASTF